MKSGTHTSNHARYCLIEMNNTLPTLYERFLNFQKCARIECTCPNNMLDELKEIEVGLLEVNTLPSEQSLTMEELYLRCYIE